MPTITLRLVLALALAVASLACPASAQPAGNPLEAYFGNTIVCARGIDGADSCHLWLARDGSLVLFGDGMQIGHPGHYTTGQTRPDGAVPVCLFLDTRGLDIAPELRPAAALSDAALLFRFHGGLCYNLGPHALGDHWTVTDDPMPAAPGHPNQMFLLPGHR